jgi:hypothetical protein
MMINKGMILTLRFVVCDCEAATILLWSIDPIILAFDELSPSFCFKCNLYSHWNCVLSSDTSLMRDCGLFSVLFSFILSRFLLTVHPSKGAHFFQAAINSRDSLIFEV